MAVKVEAVRGNLRLRWSVGTQRYSIGLGLKDSPKNRGLAMVKAGQIEQDIALGTFDSSLKRYKAARDLRMPELFRRFLEVKTKTLDISADVVYLPLLPRLPDIIPTPSNLAVLVAAAASKNAQLHKARVRALNQAFQWGYKQGLMGQQLYISPKDVLTSKRPKEKPEPFTIAEVQMILEGFKDHKTYHYYYDPLVLLFGTGMRLSEAFGLHWEQIDLLAATIKIDRGIVRRQVKPTKTGLTRTIKIPPKPLEMLRSRQGSGGLVFQSATGLPVDIEHLRLWAWKPILEELGIPYRSPYKTRHTFISHCLERGMNPVTVAAITGHSPEILMKHYALTLSLDLPDLF